MASPSETISTKKLSNVVADLPKSSGSQGKTLDSCPNSLSKNNIPRLGLNLDKNNSIKISSFLSPTLLSLPPLPRSKSCPLPRDGVSLEDALEHEMKYGKRKLDPNMDKKKLRRTISNRLSAQRSRVKKAQYIFDMEKMVEDLQDLISNLTPQIESCKENQKLLLLEHDSLQMALENHINNSELREKELEAKKIQVEKLRELEKAVKKHKHVGQKLVDKKFPVQQQLYPSISFYQNRLQNSHKFGFNHQQNILPSRVKQEPADSEDANIDQYLNFDIINVDSSKA